MAATDRSTSASVVDQLDTEMRIRRRPCQLVAPIQHSPDALHGIDDPVRSSLVGTETDQHLVEHDVVDDLTPRRAPSCSANRRARAQHRSTSPATPARPSSRSAAQVAKPLARREDSST